MAEVADPNSYTELDLYNQGWPPPLVDLHYRRVTHMRLCLKSGLQWDITDAFPIQLQLGWVNFRWALVKQGKAIPQYVRVDDIEQCMMVQGATTEAISTIGHTGDNKVNPADVPPVLVDNPL